jgi:hypothetical protein
MGGHGFGRKQGRGGFEGAKHPCVSRKRSGDFPLTICVGNRRMRPHGTLDVRIRPSAPHQATLAEFWPSLAANGDT